LGRFYPHVEKVFSEQSIGACGAVKGLFGCTGGCVGGGRGGVRAVGGGRAGVCLAWGARFFPRRRRGGAEHWRGGGNLTPHCRQAAGYRAGRGAFGRGACSFTQSCGGGAALGCLLRSAAGRSEMRANGGVRAGRGCSLKVVRVWGGNRFGRGWSKARRRKKLIATRRRDIVRCGVRSGGVSARSHSLAWAATWPFTVSRRRGGAALSKSCGCGVAAGSGG